jgi:hypothetical protein
VTKHAFSEHSGDRMSPGRRGRAIYVRLPDRAG